MNIKDCIESFMFHCMYEKNLSPKTISAYSSDFEQFITFLKIIINDDNPDIIEIDKTVIKKYVEHLIKTYQVKSVKRKVASLKAFLNHLEFEDIITVNPFRKIKMKLKIPQKLPNVLSLKEVKLIWKKAYQDLQDNQQNDTYSFLSVNRDIAILELLFGTGLRISELCSLKVQQIDFKNNIVQIFGKGAKERIIHLCNSEIIKSLKTYDKLIGVKNRNREYFFLNRLQEPISDQSVRLMIKKYAKLAKIDKNITPHTFRHTFATLLLEEGVDIKYIQHFLGHSSISTTQIYTHVNQKSQKKMLNTKHPRKNFSMLDEHLVE
ncbi:MAG: tyrosine-type recombinase/integrase [Candidatus Cloacimonetes bacterium]|nr:tyrosine-type recombinase/integrase [Candidatus Cloacimonadota bacterium]